MTTRTQGWSELSRVAEAAETDGGTVGFAVLAPDGELVQRHGDRRFRAASTIKIGVMIESYRQIDRGERRLDGTVTLTATEKTPGSGILLHLHDGLPLTIADLLYLMMSISDNSATNMLIDMAGLEQINATLRELGCTTSELGRKMKGRPAREGEPENWATPREFADLVRAILDGTAASAESCAAMVDLLEKQQNGRRIGRYVPRAEGVRWGSKTGSLDGVTNDAGFVITPAGRLIVAVYCEALPDPHQGEQVIGEITRAALRAAFGDA